jgi:hypothetical protein
MKNKLYMHKCLYKIAIYEKTDHFSNFMFEQHDGHIC